MIRVKVKDLQDLQLILVKKGLSQRAFGRLAGISEPYANQILTGERNPGPAIAKKICDALEVEFEEIFFIETACRSEQEISASLEPTGSE